MNCQKCGSNVNLGEKFCRVCGTKLDIDRQTSVEMLQPNNIQSNPNMQNFNYGVGSDNYNNDALIDAYIGKNAEKLRNGGFSRSTFCFGAIYVLYRKMWLLGLIWFIGSIIVSLFLPSFATILSIVANIVISIQFNKWYLQHVEENVQKIKNKNVGASQDQLMRICAQKGGTTIWPIVIAIVLYVFIILVSFIVSFSLINALKENIKDDYNQYEEENNNSANDIDIPSTDGSKISNLIIDMPSTFTKSDYNTDTYMYYSLIDSNDYCSLTVTVTSDTFYDSPQTYLEKSVNYSLTDTVSSIVQKNINGFNWYYMSLQTSYNTAYYYVTSNGGNIYSVEYKIVDDSGVCSSAYLSAISSLKFN